MTAETNALTAAAVVANVAVLAAPARLWHVAINAGIPALYCVSLVVSLLGRTQARDNTAGLALVEISQAAREELERQRIRDAPWVPAAHQAQESVDSALTLVTVLTGDETDRVKLEIALAGVTSSVAPRAAVEVAAQRAVSLDQLVLAFWPRITSAVCWELTAWSVVTILANATPTRRGRAPAAVGLTTGQLNSGC